MKLLMTKEEMAQDIANTLHRVGLKADTEEQMAEEIKYMPRDVAKALKKNVEDALFGLHYPRGDAAYRGDHKRGQMLNGQRYLLRGIEMLLEERL